MAAKNTIGAKIVLDGEKEYRSAINGINSAQKELRSEMTLVKSSFDGQQNSLDALTAKHEVLSKQIELQTGKVEVYSKALTASQEAEEQAGQKVETLTNDLEEAQKQMNLMKESSDVSKEALAQQQSVIDELSQKLEKAEGDYARAEASTQKWQTTLNYAQADLNAMSGEMQKLESYMEEARSSTDKCASSIDEMGKELKDASDNVSTFGELFKASIASEAALAAVDKLVSVIKTAGSELVNLGIDAALYADDILTMSTQTGISTEKLQEMKYAEELMDVSLQTMTSSIVKNTKTMDKARGGSADAEEAYRRLGVQIEDTDGNFRDSEDVFWDCIDALKDIKNETERDAIAMKIFGKKTQELNSVISIGSSGFQELAQEAHDAGYVMEKDTLNGLLKTSDAMERMKKQTDALKNGLGKEIAPMLETSFSKVTEAVKKSQKPLEELAGDIIPALTDGLVWIVDNSDIVLAGIVGITSAIVAHAAITPIIEAGAGAWGLYQMATEGAAAGQELLNGAMMANPIGALVGVIAGAVAAIAVYSSTTEDATEKIKDNVENVKKQKAAYDDMQEGNKKNTEYVKSLQSEILNLNAKEKLSNEERSRMVQLVAELNKVMPEYTLEVDKATGKIKGNTDALKKNLEEQVKQYELAKNQEELEELVGNISEARKAETDVTEALTAAQEELTKAQENYTKIVESYPEGIGQAEAELDACRDKVNNLKSAQDDASGVVKDYEKRFEELSGIVEQSSEDLKQAGDTTIEYKGQVFEASEEIIQNVSEIQNAYVEAKVKAQDSIDSQVGLFSELSNKSDLTAQQMKKNLDSQAETLTTYESDLNKLKQSNNTSVQEILKDLASMGIEGAGYVHELANATDKEMGDIVESFKKAKDAKKSLADTLADIKTDYTSQMDALLGIQQTKQTEMQDAETANAAATVEIMKAAQAEQVQIAADTAAQITETVKTETPELQIAVTEMTAAAVDTTDTELNIVAGKSVVFQDIGKSLPIGMAAGVKDGTSEFITAIEDMIQKATDAAVAKIKSAKSKIDKELGSAMK